MNRLKISRFIIAFAFTGFACNNQDLSPGAQSIEQLSIDVAQTSGQLASGASFAFAGSSTDTTGGHPPGKRGPGPRGPHGPGRNPGILDGLNMLAPTDELLAIVDAESASDVRGLRISSNGGATITNFDAGGNEVTVPLNVKKGPHGCSFSGKQFPEYDSLLGSIVKTVIDFGTGVTFRRDTVEITRSGKIIIERSGDEITRTERTTFEDYTVNGIKIEGIKTRTSTFDEATGSGSSSTVVTNGMITLLDGTVATWESERIRVSNITLNEDGRPENGTITTEVTTSVVANGVTIYAHHTASPLVENLACEGRRKGPVSGILATTYRDTGISVDYGNGSCENRTITITVNGVTTTRIIGG